MSSFLFGYGLSFNTKPSSEDKLGSTGYSERVNVGSKKQENRDLTQKTNKK